MNDIRELLTHIEPLELRKMALALCPALPRTIVDGTLVDWLYNRIIVSDELKERVVSYCDDKGIRGHKC